MRRDSPPRRSLLLRLLALSALVSLCSIAATAWLTARTTTGVIRQERRQALADQARIYDELLGYAATHRDWSGVEPTVRRLAADTGQRVLLTTPRFEPLVDSDPGSTPPRTPTATLDPLAVDPSLLPGSPDDRIDARAVGPFQPTAAERAARDEAARSRSRCTEAAPCASPVVLEAPAARENSALADLTALVNTCLDLRHLPPVSLPSPPRDEATADCLADSRRRQLARYVAPPALLFTGTTADGPVLSTPHHGQVAEVAALVLILSVAITTAVGLRLSRPLNALTRAARRMAEGDLTARVATSGRDEIAQLAAAFNAMAQRRQRLEELRRDLVGDIAHELRTPLTNIRGWLEAVEDGVVPADTALSASLLQEALQLQHLIDDLRDLSTADAGRLTLQLRPVNAADLLAQVATAHGAHARASGVTLTLEPPPPACELLADPVRLRQLVGNLVTNAVHHSPPGATVTLRARTAPDALLVSVTDTGPGIAPADLPHLFDRFWRAPAPHPGSGLGLAIVRHLTHLHHGTVRATATPAHGTTFTVRLPLAAGP
ncbi:ATP-binding protein [Kitasatospora sp. NPDC101183]|uniref:HAMP domain-containing sensor histidine kinase n=1 Tax=Kitasatospora sp. NPDC101183 TaxID=3364100 RepID=UPI00380D3A1A